MSAIRKVRTTGDRDGLCAVTSPNSDMAPPQGRRGDPEYENRWGGRQPLGHCLDAPERPRLGSAQPGPCVLGPALPRAKERIMYELSAPGWFSKVNGFEVTHHELPLDILEEGGTFIAHNGIEWHRQDGPNADIFNTRVDRGYPIAAWSVDEDGLV